MDRGLHRAHAELDDSHWWFRGRRRVIQATIAHHVGHTTDRIVLDVGCGAGGLLPMLGRFGRVTAIEGDAQAAKTAGARNPTAVVQHGQLPQAIAALPVADLITAFDVIEHLDDDVAALRQLRGRMATGGFICVTVPALPWMWSAHDEVNGHRRRYTRSSLAAAMRAAGYELVHISYFNSLLFPLVAGARLLERLRGSSAKGGDFSHSLGPADRLLESVFSLERHIVPRCALPIGVSLIAVGSIV